MKTTSLLLLCGFSLLGISSLPLKASPINQTNQESTPTNLTLDGPPSGSNTTPPQSSFEEEKQEIEENLDFLTTRGDEQEVSFFRTQLDNIAPEDLNALAPLRQIVEDTALYYNYGENSLKTYYIEEHPDLKIEPDKPSLPELATLSIDSDSSTPPPQSTLWALLGVSVHLRGQATWQAALASEQSNDILVPAWQAVKGDAQAALEGAQEALTPLDQTSIVAANYNTKRSQNYFQAANDRLNNLSILNQLGLEIQKHQNLLKQQTKDKEEGDQVALDHDSQQLDLQNKIINQYFSISQDLLSAVKSYEIAAVSWKQAANLSDGTYNQQLTSIYEMLDQKEQELFAQQEPGDDHLQKLVKQKGPEDFASESEEEKQNFLAQLENFSSGNQEALTALHEKSAEEQVLFLEKLKEFVEFVKIDPSITADQSASVASQTNQVAILREGLAGQKIENLQKLIESEQKLSQPQEKENAKEPEPQQKENDPQDKEDAKEAEPQQKEDQLEHDQLSKNKKTQGYKNFKDRK